MFITSTGSGRYCQIVWNRDASAVLKQGSVGPHYKNSYMPKWNRNT